MAGRACPIPHASTTRMGAHPRGLVTASVRSAETGVCLTTKSRRSWSSSTRRGRHGIPGGTSRTTWSPSPSGCTGDRCAGLVAARLGCPAGRASRGRSRSGSSCALATPQAIRLNNRSTRASSAAASAWVFSRCSCPMSPLCRAQCGCWPCPVSTITDGSVLTVSTRARSTTSTVAAPRQPFGLRSRSARCRRRGRRRGTAVARCGGGPSHRSCGP